MKHIKIFLVCVGGVLATASVCAQEQQKDSTLNRTVVVENQYNPEVMDAFKVNVLPEIEEPSVKKRNIDYAASVRSFGKWVAEPMEAITRNVIQPDAPKGYVRGAYGSRNNADVKTSYLWNITDKDRLDAMGAFHGFNGTIPLKDAGDWKSRFYRMDLSAVYTHAFDKLDMRVGGDFSGQWFNYMPNAGSRPVAPDDDNRRFTVGGGFVGVRSHASDLPLQFDAQVGVQTANRHSGPNRSDAGMGYGAENKIRTAADVWGDMGNGQQIGIAFEMNNLIYKDSRMEDYTSLELNPYYTFRNDNWKLRVGAHVDWQSGNGNTLGVAPDVKAEYVFGGSYVLYVQAMGGRQLNDFVRLNGRSPYWVQDRQLKSSYTHTDAQIGFKASPTDGLGVKLFGGYRITKNEVFTTPVVAASAHLRPYLLQDKAKVAYAGAGLKYACKDWFDLGVDATFYDWDTKQGNAYMLAYKPWMVLGAYADARIMPALHVRLNYHYEERKERGGIKADAVNDLSAEAAYELFERFNVFVRLGNLMNRHYITETGYPVQGFHVMGGISYRF